MNKEQNQSYSKTHKRLKDFVLSWLIRLSLMVCLHYFVSGEQGKTTKFPHLKCIRISKIHLYVDNKANIKISLEIQKKLQTNSGILLTVTYLIFCVFLNYRLNIYILHKKFNIQVKFKWKEHCRSKTTTLCHRPVSI